MNIASNLVEEYKILTVAFPGSFSLLTKGFDYNFGKLDVPY